MNPIIPEEKNEITAVRLRNKPGADGFPLSEEWERSEAVRFSRDWQGRNPDPKRETEARLLWDAEHLYLRFRCRYRTLTVFDDSEPNGRRDALWDRDVAEVFLQPDRFGSRYYKEFEVAPNGMWVDLELRPEGRRDLPSGLRRSVALDEAAHTWTAVLAIPFRAILLNCDAPLTTDSRQLITCTGAPPLSRPLATGRDEETSVPPQSWRINFYRCEGTDPERAYLAWRPTNTSQPNFHVPESFGTLKFVE